ncbi:MBL fold metallo-hydrolase [candidate division WOR-3 bacterium]|nr:MBL fold metallo-hydrolase [candidate division WOR-3 bacterium]
MNNVDIRRKARKDYFCVRISVINCFLLEARDGYLLIDTGYRGGYEQFIKGLKKIEIDISEIRYILLTHHHCDHTGLAAQLLKDTGAKLIVHKASIPLLEKGATKMGRGVNLLIKIVMSAFSFFSVSTFSPVTICEEDYIVDGDDADLLKEIGIDGIILYTPGHTEDSISVLLSDGSAFVGDVAVNFIITPYHIIIDDIDDVHNSWERLIKHGAKTIYPAHGKPFGIERLVACKEKRRV